MNSIYDIVVKIGSMALIRHEDGDIDYNIFSRLSAALRPGMLLVSSGATEIGRIDYMKRNGGMELAGDVEDVKTDYAAQGQAILMENYRRFVSPAYSVRQMLVEHSHFNDAEKREHILRLLKRAPSQNAIPIINYNDPVSSEENRKMELKRIGNGHSVVECVDNDETAAVIAMLVKAGTLVLLTSVDGIYEVPSDPSTLIREISGATPQELERNVAEAIECCQGASRAGANGAGAKLKYSLEPAKAGTHVYIARASSRIEDIVSGKALSTHIYVK